jgi:hypothetical protein
MGDRQENGFEVFELDMLLVCESDTMLCCWRSCEAYLCLPITVAARSSPARRLGSWVRIPLKAWMSVCVYSVFVLGSGLATGLFPTQGVLPTVLDQETEVKRSISRTPYAPSGSNRNIRRRRKWWWSLSRELGVIDFGPLVIKQMIYSIAHWITLYRNNNEPLKFDVSVTWSVHTEKDVGMCNDEF